MLEIGLLNSDNKKSNYLRGLNFDVDFDWNFVQRPSFYLSLTVLSARKKNRIIKRQGQHLAINYKPMTAKQVSYLMGQPVS